MNKNHVERVLVPASRRKLSLQELERKCLSRLTHLVGDAASWPLEDYGAGWRIGDYRIVIIETVMAPDAALYVQFWSEPAQAVDWEVSSGHLNPGARRFITARTRRTLASMDFRIGGEAGNFAKNVTIGHTGDAAAVARDVLRIFHDALGYRGATPLVARLIRASRSRTATVYTELTPDDVLTLLRRMGYDAEVTRRGERPVIVAEGQGFRFAITLAAPVDDHGAFRCLDFVAIVGRVSSGLGPAWEMALNTLNGQSRVARAWIDDDGDIAVGTSFMCCEGLTEGYLAEQVGAWRRTAERLIGGPPRLQDRDQSAEESLASDDPEDTGRGPGDVVH